MRQLSRRRESGIVLIKVLLYTALFLVLAAAGARTSRTELRISNNELLHEQALAVAEAGLHHAFGVMQANPSSAPFTPELGSGGTAGLMTQIGVAGQFRGQNKRFVNFGGAATDGYYVHVEDNHDERADTDDPATDRDYAVRIVSTGLVENAMSVIEATVYKEPQFGRGLAGRNVTISGGASTDSYDSSLGPYNVNGNRGPNGDVYAYDGDITINGSPTKIEGDARASGIIVKETDTNITGLRETGVPPLQFDPVPDCATVMGFSNGSGIDLAGAKYVGNKLTIGNGDTPSLSMAGSPYCFDSISMTPGGQLWAPAPTDTCPTDPAAPCVQIYVRQPTSLSGEINNVTTIPKNLQLFSSYVSTATNTALDITADTNAYMVVYAPNANVKFTSSGGDFYGSLVGANVRVSGAFSFHFDESLNDIVNPPPKLAHWLERRIE